MDEDLTSVTRTTFRVVDFLSWQRHGQLDLRPPFQRESVWTRKARSYLIDTILRGYPVPLIFLQDDTNPETLEPRRQVVDGQQRLRTVLSFIDLSCLPDVDDSDDFELMRAHRPEPGVSTFQQLPERLRDRVLDYEFSVHVLSSGTPNSVVLEIFARMNSTGTRLNDQELRNAEFHGEFKSTMHQLAMGCLDDLLGWGTVTEKQVSRMRDRELVSELVTLMFEGVTAKSKSKLSEYYKKYDDQFVEADEVSRRFNLVMETLRAVLGPEAPPDGGPGVPRSMRTQSWLYALFALTYVMRFGDVDLTSTAKGKRVDRERIRRGLVEVSQAIGTGRIPDDLAKALRGAATDKSSREARVRFLQEATR